MHRKLCQPKVVYRQRLEGNLSSMEDKRMVSRQHRDLELDPRLALFPTRALPRQDREHTR